MNPDLSIVIISWNTRQLLEDCLRSVFEEPTGLRLEVFVADNASADGSAEMVRERFPQVKLIENHDNLGFAAANNRVFPLCTAELLLLLNSDTVVQGQALRTLCEFMKTHPRAGAVGPRLLHPLMRLRVLGCGRRVTLRTTFNHYFFLSALFPRKPAFEGIHYYVGVHDDHPREVGWISGACLLVRRAVIEQIGALNERWFMYAEDQEWCGRMADAGWQLFQEPAAVVDHYLGASTRQNAKVSLMPITAGRDLYVELNHPSRFRLGLFDLIRTVGLGARAAAYWVRAGLDAGRRAVWLTRAREFRAYTRAAAPWTQRKSGV